MKTKLSALYTASLAALCLQPAYANDLLITGVVDATLTGGTPKAVEIYVVNDIDDLSVCGIGSANNGGGSDGKEYTFPAGSVTAGSYLYAATETDNFTAYFGFAPNYTDGALGINGDDAVELFCNDTVVDTFGDINVDGSGESWEYLDGWAYRKSDTGPDGTSFNVANWTFSGVDALDGAADNATSNAPFPLRSYSGDGDPIIDEPVVEVVLGVCGDDATLISTIQGNGSASDLVGETHVIEGLVTASIDGLNGFFVQEETQDMDDDDLSSEGIFVYSSAEHPEVGQVVRVLGSVSEYFNKTQMSASSVSSSCGSATAPITDLMLPFHTEEAKEALEGMLVSSYQELQVTNNYTLARFGEVTLSSNRLFTPTNIHAPGSAEAIALAESNELDRIILDDGVSAQNPDVVPFPTGGLSASNTLRTGDAVSLLTGVVDYSFNEYRVIPTTAPTFVAANARTSEPDIILGNVTVASLNVLNYFNGVDNGESTCGPESASSCRGADSALEFERQKAKTIAALVAMDADIVGLMEIENNGFGEGSAIDDLVDGINAVMGENTYSIVDAGGPVGTDAITVALIYKSGVIGLEGDLAILSSANSSSDENGVLFDDSRNRPALAQKFTLLENGESLVVSVNHLKSKGSSCGEGDDDTSTGQGNCNLTRTRAAQALATFIDEQFPDQPALIVGDLNSYAKEDPIQALESAGYTDLISTFGGSTAYSYSFDGQLGYLDHAMANAAAFGKTLDTNEWHINADEPIALDYNTEFKSDDQIITYYADDAYRMSDHDPVIISLQLEAPVEEVEEDNDDDTDNDSSGGSMGMLWLSLLALIIWRRKFN